MPHDPELAAETRAWLNKARIDLRAAGHDLGADPPLLEDIVFHAQQAVEKCLKALLTWNGVTFRKTHGLEELGEACLRLEPMLRPLVDRAVPLTEYAWRFRYPGEEGRIPLEARGRGCPGDRPGGLRCCRARPPGGCETMK